MEERAAGLLLANRGRARGVAAVIEEHVDHGLDMRCLGILEGVDEDGFILAGIVVQFLDDARDHQKCVGWAGDNQRIGAIVGRCIHLHLPPRSRLLLLAASCPDIAAAEWPATAGSTSAKGPTSAKRPTTARSAPALSEAPEGIELSTLSAALLCALVLFLEDIVDQPRRAGRAGIFELKDFHLRRVGQMRIQRADDLHDALNVGGAVGENDRVARGVGGEIGIGRNEGRKIGLELHRVGVADGDDIGHQLIARIDLQRVVPGADGDRHALGLVAGHDLEHPPLLNRRVTGPRVSQNRVEHRQNLIALDRLFAQQRHFPFRLGFFHDDESGHFRKLFEHRVDRCILEVQNNSAISADDPLRAVGLSAWRWPRRRLRRRQLRAGNGRR